MVEAISAQCVCTDSSYEKNVHIQKATAVKRAQLITDVSYDVKLLLPKGEWITGSCRVEFTVKQMPTTDMHIDFRGISIGNYKVNGVNAESALSPELLFKDH
jgi:hypothetical protein